MRTKMTHALKLRKCYCDPVYQGRKSFEVRYNDRNFQVGDYVKFRPVDDNGNDIRHPVEDAFYVITYVLSDPDYNKEHYCVFSIRQIGIA